MTTAERIKTILEKEPYKYKQVELVPLVGVTRQRIEQIVKRLKLKHLVITKRPIFCVNCGKELHYKTPKSGLCRECYKRLGLVVIQCDYCQSLLLRKLRKVQRNTLNFCNNSCEGKYMARKYNFGRKKLLEVK